MLIMLIMLTILQTKALRSACGFSEHQPGLQHESLPFCMVRRGLRLWVVAEFFGAKSRMLPVNEDEILFLLKTHVFFESLCGCWFSVVGFFVGSGLPKSSFVGGCYPQGFNHRRSGCVPGDQRFGWSDCTLAGSGEGRCDREGAAADLVVGGPGGVGGHFKVGSDSRIRLSENRGAPNPGSHMSKKGYDDACDMRDLMILPGYQNRGHKSGWCWKCQSCELRSVTILAAMIPSGLGWLDQVSERGAESCMNGFFVSCGKGGWWHLKAEIRGNLKRIGIVLLPVRNRLSIMDCSAEMCQADALDSKPAPTHHPPNH